ncbi:MAG: 50S ribosomal protein L10 [Acidobacteriota bacterium]
MNRTEKAAEVNRLETEFAGTENAFLLGLAGLKVSQVVELRRQIRATSSRCKVIKNTLAEIAGSKTRLKDLTKDLRGPVAIAYTDSKDPSALAKALYNASKSLPKLAVRAGFVGGKVVSPEKLAEISTLPSRQELLGKLAFLLAQPISRLAGVLAAPVRTLGAVMGQLKSRKEA